MRSIAVYLSYSIETWKSHPVIYDYLSDVSNRLMGKFNFDTVDAQREAMIIFLQLTIAERIRAVVRGNVVFASEKADEPRLFYNGFQSNQVFAEYRFYQAIPDANEFARELIVSEIVGKNPLKRLSLQSIFNKAWQKFVVEKNPPARDPYTGNCAYGTEDGRRCAVGWSFPNVDFLLRAKDGFQAVIQTHPFLFDVDLVYNTKLSDLNGFQASLHDNLCTESEDGEPSEWKEGIDLEQHYREIAKSFRGLSVPGESA